MYVYIFIHQYLSRTETKNKRGPAQKQQGPETKFPGPAVCYSELSSGSTSAVITWISSSAVYWKTFRLV